MLKKLNATFVACVVLQKIVLGEDGHYETMKNNRATTRQLEETQRELVTKVGDRQLVCGLLNNSSHSLERQSPLS